MFDGGLLLFFEAFALSFCFLGGEFSKALSLALPGLPFLLSLLRRDLSQADLLLLSSFRQFLFLFGLLGSLALGNNRCSGAFSLCKCCLSGCDSLLLNKDGLLGCTCFGCQLLQLGSGFLR